MVSLILNDFVLVVVVVNAVVVADVADFLAIVAAVTRATHYQVAENT